jgi:8-oxo-dGTP diphosphatase
MGVKKGVLYIKSPLLTVDAVITADNAIVLIRRKNPPYDGYWALPGGFVEYGETVEQAVLREVREETGLLVELAGVLGVYSDPERDPRGHVITVCFMARKISGELRAATDSAEVSYYTVEEALKLDLAFDHKEILKDALKIVSTS